MNKKLGLFGLGLGLCALCGIGFGLKSQNFAIARAEGDESVEIVSESVEESVEETFECKVVIAETKNGSVTVDKVEGHVGEIVTATVKHDIFYLIKSVSVNGTALIESEEISGEYSFALVEGENKIVAEIVINEELLGTMSVMVEQAKNKDWTNLFSVENVVRVVTIVLNSGMLIAMVRYFIRDKKLAAKVEKGVKESVEKIVPDMTKETVTKTIQDVVAPIVENMAADNQELMKAMSVFAKCMALSQENTPEARNAILNELSTLKIGDMKSIEEAKKEIADFMEKKLKEFGDLLGQIDAIKKSNQIETKSEETKEEVEEVEEEIKDNGTQI